MDRTLPTRTCPECSGGDHVFRGRRTVASADGGGGAEVETKYKCEGCGHEWKVRTPAPRAA